MQDHKHRPDLGILWEQIDDPNADELLRQVARLILENKQELSAAAPIDSESRGTLNENVLVEEHKQTTINQ
jgi:hypothetical protein